MVLQSPKGGPYSPISCGQCAEAPYRAKDKKGERDPAAKSLGETAAPR